MNIFYLHSDPFKAAKYQYNKHAVKMVLESAQMLCTAHHHYGNGDNVPYRKAHYNHPSTVWARQSTQHYSWLLDHFIGLADEYHKRYGKRHLAFEKCIDSLLNPPVGMPDNGFVEPPQCMPDEYKSSSAIHAYWQYYINEKRSVVNSDETAYESVPYEVADIIRREHDNTVVKN
jgi:hypothetical protein